MAHRVTLASALLVSCKEDYASNKESYGEDFSLRYHKLSTMAKHFDTVNFCAFSPPEEFILKETYDSVSFRLGGGGDTIGKPQPVQRSKCSDCYP